MKNVTIQRAFEAVLRGWNIPTGWAIAWPNATISPEPPYLKPDLIPAPTTVFGMQQIGRTSRGIFQVLVVAPPGDGSQEYADACDSIAAHFDSLMLPRVDVNTGEAISGYATPEGTIYLSGASYTGSSYNGELGYVTPISMSYRADS